MNGPKVLSLGEALVDVVWHDGKSEEHVGGSLLNVGCGLARLGHDTTVGTWFGRDPRGGQITEWARAAGAQLHEGSDGAERTSVAYATLDAAGSASYDFDLTWQLPAMGDLDAVNHLHTGSIAATLEPGGTQLLQTVKAVRDHATVSYDPNVRPALMHSPQTVMQRIEELISLSDLVKASEEDVEWLYAGKPLQAVMRRWRTMGPAMVGVTRGPWGAWAAFGSDSDMLVVDQMNVEVADTVGAGDSFMAGLFRVAGRRPSRRRPGTRPHPAGPLGRRPRGPPPGRRHRGLRLSDGPDPILPTGQRWQPCSPTHRRSTTEPLRSKVGAVRRTRLHGLAQRLRIGPDAALGQAPGKGRPHHAVLPSAAGPLRHSHRLAGNVPGPPTPRFQHIARLSGAGEEDEGGQLGASPRLFGGRGRGPNVSRRKVR